MYAGAGGSNLDTGASTVATALIVTLAREVFETHSPERFHSNNLGALRQTTSARGA